MIMLTINNIEESMGLYPLFRFEQSDDPMLTDDQYVLIENKNITVHLCPYESCFVVNAWESSTNRMYSKDYDGLLDAMEHAVSLRYLK